MSNVSNTPVTQLILGVKGQQHIFVDCGESLENVGQSECPHTMTFYYRRDGLNSPTLILSIQISMGWFR